jgi:hypothetical protein
VPRPPAICFVDLTGYTQLTEERGDEVAARVAGRLAWLVNDVARSRGGRPVRWLGGRRVVPPPGALDGGDRRARHGRVRPRRRPAARPRRHPHRSRHLPGRRRVREDRQRGRQDRVVRTGRAGRGERGDRSPVRPSCAAVRAAGSGRPQGRRQAPAPLPSLPRGVRVGAAQTPGPLPRSWSGPPGRPAAHQGPMYQQDPSADAGHGTCPSAGWCSVSMPPPPPLVSRPGTCPAPRLRAGRARSRLARWV